MPAADELYREGEQLKDQGQLAAAVEKFVAAAAADPNYSLPHLALAVVLGRLGKHEEAIEHAQTASRLEPNDPFSFTALSVTLQRAFAGTQNPTYIPLAEEAMARARMLESQR